MPSIFIIGEVMLEMTQPRPHTVPEETRLGFGGDTFNTALYLARLGHSPQYVTALGRDPYSDRLIETMDEEAIQTDYVLRHPDRLPGLYAIRTDMQGERQFFYWRSQSAARALFSLGDIDPALDAMKQADWLYLSGISLSLFAANDRDRLMDVAATIKARGGEIVFDPNYRPAGWPDQDAARLAMTDFASVTTIALPTAEDEDALFGASDAENHAYRWLEAGAHTVVEKVGPDGAILFRTGHDPVTIQTQADPSPVDTTGAGDSFNAGFLAARIGGASVHDAVRSGHKLAGTVIRYPGAIIPREAMPI